MQFCPVLEMSTITNIIALKTIRSLTLRNKCIRQYTLCVCVCEREPPLDRHMLFFTSLFSPTTGKKYSRRYQVPAETERFVWLSRDHTLYPGSWSKWKLPLNCRWCSASKTVNAKTFTDIGSKTEFAYTTVCKVCRQLVQDQLFFPHQHWRTCTLLLGH